MKHKTVHAYPSPGDAITPCCGKTPLQLAIGDLISRQPDRVTCGKGER